MKKKDKSLYHNVDDVLLKRAITLAGTFNLLLKPMGYSRFNGMGMIGFKMYLSLPFGFNCNVYPVSRVGWKEPVKQP